MNPVHKHPSLIWKQRGNFTLLELLIVIAIIAILAGILLPALNSARNKARSISCVSNHKQFGTAFAMYANDNKDDLPTVVNNPAKIKVSNEGAKPGGQGLLALYLGYTLNTDTPVTDKLKMKLYMCPGQEEKCNFFVTEGSDRWLIDYEYWRDGRGVDSGGFGLPNNALFAAKYGKIAKRLLIICVTQNSAATYFRTAPHGNGANAVYGDGSTRSIPFVLYNGENQGSSNLWKRLDR